MKTYFVWLDDERPISEVAIRIAADDVYFIKFTKAENCMKWLKKHCGDSKVYISFDHDLGETLTGYDVAKYIVGNQLALAGFACHSMNPVGVKNICELLEHYGYHKMRHWRELNG